MAGVSTSSAQQRASNAYRADIDGLRAIAIISVVLYHAGVASFRGGFVGVDIFFVISGALIGAHVYSDITQKRFRITDFYRKRAKRILPALLAVLTVSTILALSLLSPLELYSFGRYSIAAIASCSNILAWYGAGYFATGVEQNPLLMTWSLGVEEQFYVIFPLLMLLLSRLRRRSLFIVIGCIAVLSLAVCIGVTPRHRAGAFFLLPTRAWELAAGVLIAIFENGRPAKTLYADQRFANLTAAIGLALIVASVVIFDSSTLFPGFAALSPVAGAVLLLVSPASWINRRILSSRLFTFFGLISYSLYLLHWPLLSFARIVSDRPISASAGCVIAAFAVACAYLSYRFVEQRFRHSNTPAGPLLMRYAALCFVAVIPGALFVMTNGLPGRFPPLKSVDVLAGVDNDRCFAHDEPNLSSQCINRNDPRPVLALLGDSHAKVIAPEIQELANKAGYNFYEITRSSCLPITTSTDFHPTTYEELSCTSFNDRAHDLVNHDSKVRIVILAAFWTTFPDPPEVLRRKLPIEESELKSTIASLQESGKQVILIQDVPIFKFNPLRRTRSHFIPFRKVLARLFTPPFDSWNQAPLSEMFTPQDQGMKQMLQRVSAAAGVSLFDPTANFCTRTECTFYDNQSVLYVDYHHVSTVGAQIGFSNFNLSKGPGGRVAHTSNRTTTLGAPFIADAMSGFHSAEGRSEGAAGTTELPSLRQPITHPYNTQ